MIYWSYCEDVWILEYIYLIDSIVNTIDKWALFHPNLLFCARSAHEVSVQLTVPVQNVVRGLRNG